MNDRQEILPGASLLVKDSEIAALLPSGQPLPAADRTLEAKGKLLLPGLVNAHTHCAMTLLRGYADDMELMAWLRTRIWPLEMKLSAEDVYCGSLLGIAEMIRAGVTCFNDMYHYFRATARAVRDSGFRANVSGVLLGFLPEAEKKLEEAVEFADEWRGEANGRVVTMLGPHAPYTCPDPLLRKVIAAARQLGAGVHIHVSETRQEVEESLSLHGLTPLRRLQRLGLFDGGGVLAAHCVHLDEQEIELLARSRAGVSHNPGSNMKLASGVAPVPQLLKAGVPVGLGTDGAASNNNLDVLEEVRLAALLHKLSTGDPTALPAYQALEMATRHGARALGLEDKVGQIKVGLRADLILFDLDQPHLWPPHNLVSHLVYSARASDVTTVLVDGKPLMIDRVLQTLDEPAIMKEARERIERLIAN
jgi:5-methylthioadenosine/S-adenosylhomocysteine deaminase